MLTKENLTFTEDNLLGACRVFEHFLRKLFKGRVIDAFTFQSCDWVFDWGNNGKSNFHVYGIKLELLEAFTKELESTLGKHVEYTLTAKNSQFQNLTVWIVYREEFNGPLNMNWLQEAATAAEIIHKYGGWLRRGVGVEGSNQGEHLIPYVERYDMQMKEQGFPYQIER